MQKDIYLTKTDFVHYLQCPKSLWLAKHKPDIYPYTEFSDFLKKITREGYEVETYAEQLFIGGVKIPTVGAVVERTKEAITSNVPVIFQATCMKDGQFARTDVIERDETGSYTLYEVKSSTKIKRDQKHNHIKDACFQKIALEKAGLSVKKIYIIHVNKEYVRGEEINPHELLKKVDVTEEVYKLEDAVRTDIENAIGLLQSKTIDENGCACYKKTRSNHCDAFAHFNNTLENGSVWELRQVRKKKLNTLLEQGITNLKDIPADSDINDGQMRQVRSAVTGKPVIYERRIDEMLSALEFPLYFFDYETAMNAVPQVPGIRPWQQIPFQFSLHIMDQNGTLSHKEYVSDSLYNSEEVVRALIDAVNSVGSVISWHASFEKLRNKEIADRYPSHRSALESINERMFDLEDIFKEAYTDVRFKGSTSIKKVLPVLCPHLDYKELAVQDGTQAMEQWFSMIEEKDINKKERIRYNLFEYCKRDTYAMVEIYRVLKNITNTIQND